MSVWFSEPKSGGGQHLGLSRELIVRTAVEMLDEHGMAALSMRKFAAQLGAAPMSLYWHVPTKDALLELVMDHVFGEIEPPDEGVEWAVAARGWGYSLRQLGLRHPWLSQLLGKYAQVGPNVVAMAEKMLVLMRSAGLSVVESSRAVSALSSYVLGFVAAEANWASGKFDIDISRVTDKYAETAPQYVATLAEAELWSIDKQFDFGLECVIAGVQTRVTVR